MSRNQIDIMKLRAHMLSQIREFFSRNGYIEADVPSLSPAVIPEATIELFKTKQIMPWDDSRDLFMLPSPEYYLKQLISAGSGDLFSISHSFRNSEQSGRWHNPEFTMLEWYTMGADYLDSVTVTENFINHMLSSSVTQNITAAQLSRLQPPFKRMTMTEVFDEYADFDLSSHCTGEISPLEELSQLRQLASELTLMTSEKDSWEEIFNLIFVHQIEPKLPKNAPLVIYNYPAGIPALAKPAEEAGRLERWELYAGGVELANCYTEETDYNAVSDFFKTEAEAKTNALVAVKPDYRWCEMYKKPFPLCSGTALGVDRLMMMLSGSTSMEGVILFPSFDKLVDL